MPGLLGYFRLAASTLRARLAEARRNGDAGYTTETVLVIALLVALALAAIAIIAAKVLAKANSLNLGG
jgi:fatty acid desaturase